MLSMCSDYSKMKLEITQKTLKLTCMQKLNNFFLNIKWIKAQLKSEIRKYFDTNENEDKIQQNVWDVV